MGGESDLNFQVRHGPLLTYSSRGRLFGAAHSKIQSGEKPNKSDTAILLCSNPKIYTDIQVQRAY